jgi:phosphoserine phosphatase
MSYILTLVASDGGTPVSEKHFKDIAKIMAHYNLAFTGTLSWLAEKKAADRMLSDEAPFTLILHLRETLAKDRIDFFITNSENRKKRLLLADMDSTIVS